MLLSACRPGGDASPEPGSGARSEARGEDLPGLRLTDASGAVVEFPRLPTRILSLVPSGTEILDALGARHLLVGRTDHDTARALASLPSVGGGFHPSLERLVSLQPDLVILFAGESDPTTPSRLRELGIPRFAIRPEGLAGIRESIRQLGLLAGREASADSLVLVLDSTLAEIAARVRDRPRVRVAYILGGNPPWVAGGGSYLDELLRAAGGENVFADLGAPYGPVSPEQFLGRRIDLLLAPEGGEVRLPELGIPLRRVPSALEMPGPGLARWIRELACILHPETLP